MTRFLHLCSHRSRPSGCLTIRHHAQLLAHSCYIATLDRPLLRAPLAMPQVKQCQLRSMWPSHSSHSWSLFSVAMPWLLLNCPTQLSVSISLADAAVQTTAPRGVSHDSSTQTSDQPGSSLSLDVAVQTIFPQCMFFIPGCCRADALTQFSFPGTSLRSLALAQRPRFQLMRHCRLLHIVLCNLMPLHNSTSRSSSLAGFSQTVHWIVDILFVSPPPSVLGSHVVPLAAAWT